jgi:hypothetical protein
MVESNLKLGTIAILATYRDHGVAIVSELDPEMPAPHVGSNAICQALFRISDNPISDSL